MFVADGLRAQSFFKARAAPFLHQVNQKDHESRGIRLNRTKVRASKVKTGQEKVETESRLRTKGGFDVLNKRENWNEHPKKLDPFKIADLMISYAKQREETE